MSTQYATRTPFFAPFFLAFRLIYAPVVGFWHTEHGAPWLIAGLILLFSIGGEWMARRYRSPVTVGDGARPRRGLALVVVALILVGFLPEEGILALILWAGIGLAWADVLPVAGWAGWPSGWRGGSGVLAGIGLGVAGIWGPSPWVVAGVILLLRLDKLA
jgi:hypothetical protein